MTEIYFSKRTATIFQRAIECHREDWETEQKKIQDEENDSEIGDPTVILSHDGWDLSMMVDISDDDDECDWSTIRTLLFIDRSSSSRTSIYGWKSIIGYKPEDIDALIKSYRICLDCDEYCWKDTNFCKSCYPFLIEHDEDCCCCLDKSLGVWYKLPCGHILHQRCYNRISAGQCDKKCPLCRAVCSHRAWEKI